jgi:hypothetical protein
MRIADTEEREDRIRRLMEATGENTKSGAIDIACKHYLADLERKRKHVDEIPDDLIDELSTPYLPLEREITNQVGRTDA